MNTEKDIKNRLPMVNQDDAIQRPEEYDIPGGRDRTRIPTGNAAFAASFAQPIGAEKSAPTDSAWPVLNKRVSDTRILQHMARALSITLNMPDEHVDQEQSLNFFAQERRGRAHRIVIYHADELSLGRDLPFVGFISGRRQPTLAAISAEIEQLDRLLVVELASAPGVLSYSSLQLRSGNWYNLAIFGDAGAKTIFHRLDTHTYAAHQVAPRYYDWIRLHHGIIIGTLADNSMRLQYTRYITFEEQRTPAVRLVIHQLVEETEGKEHAR